MDKNDKYCCADKFNFYEMCPKCYEAYFTDAGFDDAMRESWGLPSSGVCECGSEAAGGTTHSHWCPKGDK